MTGRRTKTVLAAMVLTAAIAESAAAQAPPPRRTKPLTRCDSGKRTWNAAPPPA